MEQRAQLLALDADFVGRAPKFLHIRTSIESPEIFIVSFFFGDEITGSSYHIRCRGFEHLDNNFRFIGVWGPIVEVTAGHVSRHDSIAEMPYVSKYLSAIIDLYHPEHSNHNSCIFWISPKSGFYGLYQRARMKFVKMLEE